MTSDHPRTGRVGAGTAAIASAAVLIGIVTFLATACGSYGAGSNSDGTGEPEPASPIGTSTTAVVERLAEVVESIVSVVDAEHLAYQLAFRSSFDFLSTDPTHIAALAATGGDPEAMQFLGLELSTEEWVEMQRRMTVIERAFAVKQLVTGRAFDAAEEAAEGSGGRLPTGPLFAGVWQDHLDGGVLKVAVTDASAVDLDALYALFEGGRSDVVVIEQVYSLDELWVWRDIITDRLREMTVGSALGFDHSDVGVRLWLELVEQGRGADLDALLAGIPRDQVVIEYTDSTGEFLPGVSPRGYGGQ